MKRTAMILATLALVMLCLLTLPTQANAASESDLTFTLNEDGQSYSVTDCDTAASGSLEIPVMYNGLPVISIGMGFGSGCDNLTSIIIPDGVTSIGDCAFWGCDNLISVSIPDSMTNIGSEVFVDCDSLAYNIYDNAKYLGNNKNPYVLLCESINDDITECVIPDATKIIGYGAFANCTGLTRIDLPDSVAYIEGTAFWNCTGLTEITIPDGVISVGSSAFCNCTSLTEITIPGSVDGIGDAAFMGCTGLTHITIENGVTSIGEYAFSGCVVLTELTIPASVIDIYNAAFNACSSLKGIWVDENNPSYTNDAAGVLFNKDMTMLIQAPGGIGGDYIIPDSVVRIGNYGFFHCTGLTSVTIPNNVTSLGYIAFYNCAGLKEITIPQGVTNIGVEVFRGCTSLTDVYYDGTQEQWSAITIAEYNEPLLNATIHYMPHEVHYGQKVLALGADLSMDFYVAVSEAVANDENAVMQISLGGKAIDEIALKDAKQAEVDDEWYCWYVFTAEVPVKDITKEISLQLVDSTGNVGEAYTYSVKQYADYLLENSTDEKVLNVCQTLLDYGAAAEKHFTVRAGGTVADSELANGGDFGTRLDGVTVPAAYAPTKSGNIDGITCYATSLILEADTAIRLYFDATSAAWEGTTVTVDVIDATYQVERVNNRYVCVEITGIHAADLDTMYTVTLTRGEEHITICYSGLSYAWAVQNSSSSNETLCQLVKGLYKYWEAAEAYVKKDAPIPGENESDILPW